MNSNLNGLLNEFRYKWKDKIRIEKGYIDITDCFKNKKTNLFRAPSSFGDLNKKKVLLYIVYGAPFIEKFKRNRDGKLEYFDGRFIIKEIDTDYKVLASCLCVYPMKNVSIHEIYDAIKVNPKTECVQGFRRWVLRNIIEKIKDIYPDFDIDKDTAFIFTGDNVEQISRKIKLNKYWLNQVIDNGDKTISLMSKEECNLVKGVFGGLMSDPKRLSYMYGRENHIHESVEFLKIKFKLVDDFCKK